MDLTWNDIRARAVVFAKNRADDRGERPEAQPFWEQFFEIFGRTRWRLASYEVPVTLREGRKGFVDLFWKGTLLVEHKSRGEDLDAADSQAFDYFPGIAEVDLPKFVLVSDFKRIRLRDLGAGTVVEFPLTDLPEHIERFRFMRGEDARAYEDAAPVNVRAAELMGELHDALRANGYVGDPLAIFLVRLMFCFFADYTGIFNNRNDFRFYLEQNSRPDGHDLGPVLSHIFDILNTPEGSRQRNLGEALSAFPYVNGRLFEGHIDTPEFDVTARQTLLACCAYDWSEVSPAIFGSMFQGVMAEDGQDRRRSMGAHYTSEKNILKVIRPLFLDGLRREFETARGPKELEALLDKIAAMTLLDPACGCGNFLVVAYRELRQLELDIHLVLHRKRKDGGRRPLSREFIAGINVDAMYGIEIEEFPVRVAATALYIVDHQINQKASLELGKTIARLPLEKAPNIKRGNALEMDWETVVPPSRLSAILGNPPFVGKKARTADQKRDMTRVFGDWKDHSRLDYVSCWYVKAARYTKGTTVPAAFVSTNSITQGEQAGILWRGLLQDGIHIHFAHRTFRWTNEAKGKAHVYCVIIGFSRAVPAAARLFDYATPTAEPVEVPARRINPYLVDAADVFVMARRKPIGPAAPPISFGSMPNEEGWFLFTDTEKDRFFLDEPSAQRFVRRFLSNREFLYNEPRWCLWLKDAKPSEYNRIRLVMYRVEKVEMYRRRSKRPATRKLAQYPTLFAEIRQPDTDYIIIPRHSSERRRYIPLGIASRHDIVADSCAFVPSADLFHFGVLHSAMHMAWVRQVCGRIKSDFRYSNEIVYNNFPWPKPTEAKKAKVRESAQAVLDARASFEGETLAALYDPRTMPKVLVKAHAKLNRAVDACYRGERFPSELARLTLLFELFEAGRNGGQMEMLPAPPPEKPKRRK